VDYRGLVGCAFWPMAHSASVDRQYLEKTVTRQNQRILSRSASLEIGRDGCGRASNVKTLKLHGWAYSCSRLIVAAAGLLVAIL